MVALPRLVVAAPSTGQGKTTIATGLMAALRIAGHGVSGHKVGPDYIDPGYHALATGRPGRNLDPHLVGEDLIVPLLLHGAARPEVADIAVIEGVMGLYDGRLGTGGFASTAHVAALTASPVVLVVDVSGQSRSVGALVAGLASYDARVRVAGVILNRAGSARNVAEIEAAIAPTGIPVLGVVPTDPELQTPSRHLGLIPAAERESATQVVAQLGVHVAQHVDLGQILEIARSAPALLAEVWRPESVVTPVSGRPVIAVAGGRAFTFRYPETEELLRAAGAEVVSFDPLVDPHLPRHTQGIYLGGGFPEVYAAKLATNTTLLADLRQAVNDGIPTVAECAGLLYLAKTLDGAPMAGALPLTAAMSQRLTLRYPEATSAGDNLLTRAGETVTGHEFHRTQTQPVVGKSAAWEIEGDRFGFASNTMHASYLHLHWAGYPHLAQRFAAAAAGARPHQSQPRPATPAQSLPAESVPLALLRHHGDRETGAGLLDFAVNTYPAPPPIWLQETLRRSLRDVGTYPDVTPAREAVAARYGREVDEVLVTAGAAEAFSLIARLRRWRRPVVIHPQFTEPHAALAAHGHQVTVVSCTADTGFGIRPDLVPEDADLVVIGNPTNPTGVLHSAAIIESWCRPDRLVVVDEAFLDSIPGEPETLSRSIRPGLLVIRSLTKLWGIPGVRAGHVLGDPAEISELAELASPWSVATAAIAATTACLGAQALADAHQRAADLQLWRAELQGGLRRVGIEYVESRAPFVLARPGAQVRAALRARGIAVRRGDTFPGLGPEWIRIAARPEAHTERLLTALEICTQRQPERIY